MISLQVATGVVFLVTAFLITYTFHCTWVTSEAYSSPSIVLSARAGDGGRIIFDDFREAYYWLRHNTPEVLTESDKLLVYRYIKKPDFTCWNTVSCTFIKEIKVFSLM